MMRNWKKLHLIFPLNTVSTDKWLHNHMFSVTSLAIQVQWSVTGDEMLLIVLHFQQTHRWLTIFIKSFIRTMKSKAMNIIISAVSCKLDTTGEPFVTPLLH